MKRAITAVYEEGVLKPSEKLPLEEQQEVLVIVVPLPRNEQLLLTDEQARLAQMREQTEAWLAKQPTDAVRPPLSLPQARSRELDDAFDVALTTIRARAAQFSEAEIAADVDVALAETRALSVYDRARLDAELKAIFAEIAADVSP
jgi:predicted DNA-binding antitoxin AbrB/MazE fold protein